MFRINAVRLFVGLYSDSAPQDQKPEVRITAAMEISRLRTAVTVNPYAWLSYSTLAAGLLEQKKYADAELAAGQAVKFKSFSCYDEFLLGVSLIYQNKHTAEAEDSLKRSTDAYPEARALMASRWRELSLIKFTVRISNGRCRARVS